MKRALIIGILLTSTSTWSQMASLDDQEKCAKQAEKVFAVDQTEFRVNNPEGQERFFSHYNPRLGHCFYELSGVPDGYPISHLVNVFDAFERNVFASFWSVQKGDSEMVFSCVVGDTHCHSQAEFDALVLEKYGLVSNQ
jgi:hypothetical protein